VLAPIFFLAMNYVIFGRLLRSTIALDDVVSGGKFSSLNPRRITIIFLGSDIASFLIQATGSGLAASNDNSTTRIGLNILLAGMALNFVSFAIFISLVAYFDRATRQPYYEARMSRRFEAVIRALYISWVFIMVPSLLK
jgi:RTA1 like protein